MIVAKVGPTFKGLETCDVLLHVCVMNSCKYLKINLLSHRKYGVSALHKQAVHYSALFFA